jgi:hypothetical protein
MIGGIIRGCSGGQHAPDTREAAAKWGMPWSSGFGAHLLLLSLSHSILVSQWEPSPTFEETYDEDQSQGGRRNINQARQR